MKEKKTQTRTYRNVEESTHGDGWQQGLTGTKEPGKYAGLRCERTWQEVMMTRKGVAWSCDWVCSAMRVSGVVVVEEKTKRKGSLWSAGEGWQGDGVVDVEGGPPMLERKPWLRNKGVGDCKTKTTDSALLDGISDSNKILTHRVIYMDSDDATKETWHVK